MSLVSSTPTCELDSHADTCAFGRHSRVIHTYSEQLDVGGFHSDFKAIKAKLARVAVAYDCQLTMQTFILLFDHVLYIPTLDTNLLCPDQMRDHGLTVNDIPLLRLTHEQRSPDSHSIIHPHSDLRIPLEYSRPISFFKCRKPTHTEVSDDLNHVHCTMTSPVPWEPYDIASTRAEASLRQDYQPASAAHRFYSLHSSPPYYDVLNSTLATALGDRVQTTLSSVKTSGKSYIIKPDQLCRRWRISLPTARRTLEQTTQRAVRDWSNVEGSRRFRPTQFQLERRRIRSDVHVDVKFGPCKSLDGNTCVAVYATPYQWARGYGLKNEADVSDSLKFLFHQFGFPRSLRPDHAKSLTEGLFKKLANKAQVPIFPHEPYNPNQNLAEDTIREGVRMYNRFMTARNIPKACWDRVFIYCLELRSHIALGHPLQEGQCGTTIILGETADISHLADFAIYDWCWALSPNNSKRDSKQLCRWLGPSFEVGANLCFVCLTAKGRYLHRSSVIPLTVEERNSDDIKNMKKNFVEDLERKLRDRASGLKPDEAYGDPDESLYMRPLDYQNDDTTPQFERYEDDDMDAFETAPPEEEQPIEFDRYVGAKICETDDTGVRHFGIVKGRKRGPDGQMIGNYHENQFLDTSLYDIEWDDGNTDTYRANQIVEALLLAKEAYPVEVAEYAVANKLVSEPAFSWWVPYTLRKRDRILKAVKRRALTRKTEKFGLEVPGVGPQGVKRAYEIDAETGTQHWGKAMTKEVKTVIPALRILEEDEKVPPGFTRIDLMTVFDIKMDLTRKARICARGDQTDPPLSVTYASVVSRDSIRIGFMLAALNGLDVLSADIAGAYLNAPCAEKIYTVLGDEFGDLAGRTAIIEKALYGLKSSGFSWRSTLYKTIREVLDFKQCEGDMDVWRRPAQKSTGERYYEYMFVYVDDLIVISEHPRPILEKLGACYMLKPDSIREPTTFLGATITKHRLDGTNYDTWAMGSKEYLVESLRVVKQRISAKKYNLVLKTKVSATMPSGYKPELDGTDFVDDETATLYMQLIGILRWLVELGRIDIATEVSMMSSYNAMPRVGHFHAVLHIFAYLQSNLDWQLAMDCGYREWHGIPERDWKEFYPWAKDEKPKNMPEALGLPVRFTMFVDASHAANVVTRQSRTGVIIYVNSAPILWFSKKQNSIETSSFGSEFMALKTATEMLEGLRFKLRMMGVPIEGYCHTFVDNRSVVSNTSMPESTLKKKSNSIAYNYVRSRAAADILRIDWVDTHNNLADMLTKVHTGPIRASFRVMVMYPGDDDSDAKREIRAMDRLYMVWY